MNIWIVVILIVLCIWIMLKYSHNSEYFGTVAGICEGGDCAPGKGLTTRSYYGRDDDYSSCYKKKQIYLNGVGDSSNHGDVNLEKRFGKLYITLNCNLPYALGGIFHTMYGAYNAHLVNSKTGASIDLGTLVRQGDRFYKLTTELLGDYRGYDQITVTRKTEDYPVVNVLTGSITHQSCGGGL
jgi:hypothetical protein